MTYAVEPRVTFPACHQAPSSAQGFTCYCFLYEGSRFGGTIHDGPFFLRSRCFASVLRVFSRFVVSTLFGSPLLWTGVSMYFR
jgi:hypothetical protein